MRDKIIYSLQDLVIGEIVKRLNRFVVEIRVGGEIIKAHNTNTGRLLDYLKPGRKTLLTKISGERLRYRLVAVEDLYDSYCIVDTYTQNKIFERLVEENIISYLRGFRVRRRNPRVENTVFDYELTRESELMIIETKSAVFRGVGNEAMYPDAPTVRGRRHIAKLVELKRRNIDTGLIFIAAMKNVSCFKPYRDIDPVIDDYIYKAIRENVLVRIISIYMDAYGLVYIENPDVPICRSWLREKESQDLSIS
ncbi:MAG: DNA/RNA nuclease SfsA [Sulfolobales archaeon]